jgi:hypothetical protein
MFRLLMSIFRRLFSGRSESRPTQTFDSERMRSEINSYIRGMGGYRERDLQTIGPAASSDGVVWDREVASYVDPESGETELKLTVARQCSCGRFIGYDDVHLVGTCQQKDCENVVCTACASKCDFCGRTFCTRHIYSIQGKLYCVEHRIIGASRAFVGV